MSQRAGKNLSEDNFIPWVITCPEHWVASPSGCRALSRAVKAAAPVELQEKGGKTSKQWVVFKETGPCAFIYVNIQGKKPEDDLEKNREQEGAFGRNFQTQGRMSIKKVPRNHLIKNPKLSRGVASEVRWVRETKGALYEGRTHYSNKS